MSSRRSRSGGSVIGMTFEPVEEVLAERALLHHLLQIDVGRGDHARVELDRPRFADALDLALLQRAQQLRLQRQAHERRLRR